MTKSEQDYLHRTTIEHLWSIGEFPHIALEEMFFDTIAKYGDLRLDTDEERVAFLRTYFLQVASDEAYLDFLVQTSKYKESTL